jgi:hypothetical protein
MTLIARINPHLIDAIQCDEIDITPETKSKKAFAAYVEANPDTACIIEPAWRFDKTWGLGKPIARPSEAIGQVVTNHPRRTWFGTITRTKDGRITVK